MPISIKATEAPNEIELRQRVTHTKDIYLDKLVEFIDDSTPQDMVQKSFWTKQVDDILRDFKNDMHEVCVTLKALSKFVADDIPKSILYFFSGISCDSKSHLKCQHLFSLKN